MVTGCQKRLLRYRCMPPPDNIGFCFDRPDNIGFCLDMEPGQRVAMYGAIPEGMVAHLSRNVVRG